MNVASCATAEVTPARRACACSHAAGRDRRRSLLVAIIDLASRVEFGMNSTEDVGSYPGVPADVLLLGFFA